MPKFYKSSLDKLATCHPDLQKVMMEVVRHVDCTVLYGHRDKEDQDKAFADGTSTKMWPFSRHNSYPSEAVDVAPYPIDWGNAGTMEQRASAIARFRMFSGFVLGIAAGMGIKLRSGGDWDMDFDLSDQKFIDLPHFELVNES